MKLILALVGIFALSAGLWFWMVRAHPSPPPPAAGGTGAAPPGPANVERPLETNVERGAPIPAPPRPIGSAGSGGGGDVGEPTPAPGPAAGAVGFEVEPRDGAWAPDQERELTLRLDQVRELIAARGAKVTITGSECRTSQCRFTLDARAMSDLSALYGALETPDGLYGWADSVVLGEVEADARTGGFSTAITAVFER